MCRSVLPTHPQSGHTSVILSLSRIQRYLAPRKGRFFCPSCVVLCIYCCRVSLPMKNEVLDILILGLLVVLFASIYRKRVNARLRCWLIGWILVSGCISLRSVASGRVRTRYRSSSTVLGISTLLLSGLCFLFSASVISWNPPWQRSGRVRYRSSGALLHQLPDL